MRKFRLWWPAGARIDLGKLGWATGEIGLASYAGVSSIYLLFYATQVLRIPPTAAGLALLIPRIWNIVGDPIVGFLSDRTQTRFGRRRPYLLGGALVWGAAFCLLFNLPRLSDPLLEAVLFGAVFLLNNTGLTLYQVPYSAMLAELTRDYAERTRLVAYKEGRGTRGDSDHASVRTVAPGACRNAERRVCRDWRDLWLFVSGEWTRCFFSRRLRLLRHPRPCNTAG